MPKIPETNEALRPNFSFMELFLLNLNNVSITVYGCFCLHISPPLPFLNKYIRVLRNISINKNSTFILCTVQRLQYGMFYQHRFLQLIDLKHPGLTLMCQNVQDQPHH